MKAFFRRRRAAPGEAPADTGPWRATRLSVVLVTHDSWELCRDALRSLRAAPPRTRDDRPLALEVLVVDSASTVGDREVERELTAHPGGGARLLRLSENVGYGRAVNAGVAEATGDVLLVANADVRFEPGCVETLVRYLEDHDVAVVGPEVVLDADGRGRQPPLVEPSLTALWVDLGAALSGTLARLRARARTRAALAQWCAGGDREVGRLSGCCFALRRPVFDLSGGFDPELPLYYEDTDLFRRIARAGGRLAVAGDARLVHVHGGSGRTDPGSVRRRHDASRRQFHRKWYGGAVAALDAGIQRLLRAASSRRRTRGDAAAGVPDLGPLDAPPALDVDHDGPLLVEVSLTSDFEVASAVWGRGPRWSLGSELFERLGPTTYHLRAWATDADPPRELGRWCFTRRA